MGLRRTAMQQQRAAEYAAHCPLGTLCAYNAGGVIKTAKMIDRAATYVVLEHLSGKCYEVPYKLIVWVKTGKSWPGFLMDIFRRQKEKSFGA